MQPHLTRPDRDKTCVLIMGMHRSGTSALSGVLGLLGCGLPNTVIGGDRNNQKGYFESAPINKLNEDLLAALGSAWHDWHRISAPTDPDSLPEFADRARGVLQGELTDIDQVVLKDPRNCRLGSFWLPLVADQGYRIVALHTVRNPWEVAASLGSRDGMLVEQALLLWLRHTLEAERLTRGMKRCHTSYDALMTDWRAMVRAAGDALDLDLAAGINDAGADVDAFLADGLRHFAMDEPKQEISWTWVVEVYGIMREWAAGSEDAADHARLDEIRSQLNAAEPALGAVIDALRDTRDQLRTSHARHAHAGSKEDDLAALRSKNQTLTDRLTQSESALLQRIKETEDQHIDFVRLRHELLDLQVAANGLAAELDRQRALRAQAEAHAVDERRQRLTQEETQLRELIVLKARQAQLRDNLDKGETERSRLSAALDQEREARDDLQARLPILEKDLETVTSDRDFLKADNIALRRSNSWRVTAPMRFMMSLSRRR